jgi:hypothetical protein
MNRNAPVGKCVATEIAREIGWQEVGEESLWNHIRRKHVYTIYFNLPYVRMVSGWELLIFWNESLKDLSSHDHQQKAVQTNRGFYDKFQYNAI